MKRGGPLARRSPMKRGGRIKPKKRSADDYARIYGSPERVKWIASRPCACCGGGPCQGHHVVNGGAGRKADARFVAPLCAACHRQYHDTGCVTIARAGEPGVTLRYTYTKQWMRGVAEATEALWRAFQEAALASTPLATPTPRTPNRKDS